MVEPEYREKSLPPHHSKPNKGRACRTHCPLQVEVIIANSLLTHTPTMSTLNPDYRKHLLAWRKRADNYAAELKIRITALVPDASLRRNLFIKITRTIDALQDFIMVHDGNIARTRRSLEDATVVSSLKHTLLLRLNSLLAALPAVIVARLHLSDLLSFLLKG